MHDGKLLKDMDFNVVFCYSTCVSYWLWRMARQTYGCSLYGHRLSGFLRCCFLGGSWEITIWSIYIQIFTTLSHHTCTKHIPSPPMGKTNILLCWLVYILVTIFFHRWFLEFFKYCLYFQNRFFVFTGKERFPHDLACGGVLFYKIKFVFVIP